MASILKEPYRIHSNFPVFRLDAMGKSVIYTPGHLAVLPPSDADRIQNLLTLPTGSSQDQEQQFVSELLEVAERSVLEWQKRADEPFVPENLTLYLSNQCNLKCSYCWAATSSTHTTSRQCISLGDVARAADYVAGCCAKKNKPFSLILHGGGEPTVHWDMVKDIVALGRKCAAEHGVKLWSYIATNGVMNVSRVQWLAENIDHIGLSCDGPPAIQDNQRKMATGNSSARVEETAAIFSECGSNVTIRTTITPETAGLQQEIVQYLNETLHAKKIRFEPLYRVKGNSSFKASDAEYFVDHFLRAQREAQRRGCELRYSGVRLDTLHTSYCNFNRDSLHLLPDGSVSPCFFLIQGYRGGEVLDFLPDMKKIAQLKQQAAAIPSQCWQCVNIYHCARGCPEICMLNAPHSAQGKGFRCMVNKKLTTARLLAAIQAHEGNREEIGQSGQATAPGAANSINHYLKDLPPSIDAGQIQDNWNQISHIFHKEERRLPIPPWAEQGFDDDGTSAWRKITDRVQKDKKAENISLYCHVPFCHGRCLFCDCHSIPISRKGSDKESLFIQRTLLEIEAWSFCPEIKQRPVTTIHFGGGTPNCLQGTNLRQLTESIRRNFSCTSETEWALESTSSLLTANHLEFLNFLGFQRLHIGVQTLEQDVRKRIGRKVQQEKVLLGVEQALQQGFTVSVDLVYGLPGQTVQGFISTIEQLIALGVHGFSLYQLQSSHKNIVFTNRYAEYARHPLIEYVLFQAAEQSLIRHGYRKNHFVHYALPEDKHLYYTHKQRREDLVAFGPTADGIIDDYSYRHCDINEYLLADSKLDSPFLQGGGRNNSEHRLQYLEDNLLAGVAKQDEYVEQGLNYLLSSWLDKGMVTKTEEKNTLSLTANGSWFINLLTSRLRDVFPLL